MTLEQVQAAVQPYIDNKMPYSVYMDNMLIYNNYGGSYIKWSKDYSLAICIRSNPGPDQAANPIQVCTFSFDHIVDIRVNTKKDNVNMIKDYLTSVGGDAAAAELIIESLLKQEYVDSNIAGSTGDGIRNTPDPKGKEPSWNGTVQTKPLGDIRY